MVKSKAYLLTQQSFGYTVGDEVTISAADLAAADWDATLRQALLLTYDIVSLLMRRNILQVCHGQFDINQSVAGVSKDSLDVLGLKTAGWRKI